VDEGSKRWHEIALSDFGHERAGLAQVRDLLPCQAWSNLTFISNSGHTREVDLLVAAPSGLFLLELKSIGERSAAGTAPGSPRAVGPSTTRSSAPTRRRCPA